MESLTPKLSFKYHMYGLGRHSSHLNRQLKLGRSLFGWYMEFGYAQIFKLKVDKFDGPRYRVWEEACQYSVLYAMHLGHERVASGSKIVADPSSAG